MKPTVEWLMRYVSPEPNSGCWIWMGGLNQSNYGLSSHGLAHRASYAVHVGEIPKGLMVLHKCDTPACVNPDHLFIGSAADNMRDMTAKKRHPRHLVTACPQGHDYSSENTYRWHGKRICRRCGAAAVSRYRLKNKKIQK